MWRVLPRLNKLDRDVTGGMIKIWQSLSFIISILDRIYRYAGFTGSFFTLDGSKRIRLKKHGFYATTIKWDSHHRTCHLLLSVRFSKKNFKKRNSYLFPPRYFEEKKSFDKRNPHFHLISKSQVCEIRRWLHIQEKMNQRLLVMRARKLPVVNNASQNEIDVLNLFCWMLK